VTLLILFILCVLAAIYPIGVYPLLVWLVAALRPRRWRSGTVSDKVAFIITLFNEERKIDAKLRNTLSLIRPDAKFEIIVASDGSTDGTQEIVSRYSDCGVRWLDCPRRGKEAAQKDAIRATDAEILVFSDVSTVIDPDGLEEILRPFADPSVGAVSGTDGVSESSLTGEYLYLWYEMAMRNAESLCNSIVGLSGCFFALRRQVAEELLPDVPSDFGAALVCVRQGLRAVAQPTARCFYAATPNAGSLYRRWQRTVLRGIRCLAAYRGVVSWRRPLASWQIISHKWLRFLSPCFVVVGLIVAGWAAAACQIWGIVVWGTLLPLSMLGLLSLATGRFSHYLRVFRPVGFALVIFAAVIAAWCRLLLGRKEATWTPTERSQQRNEP
jgi:cellulose synthase/poly-beta-1,6-N-acetylglucosamine synthase-like glycosyltransferase